MIKKLFAPGCAMMLYKPELADEIHSILNKSLGKMEKLMTCCHHDPQLKELTEIINICPGCDKRYRNDYKNLKTISLWEVIAANDFFTLPNYQGQKMTIIDACPTRDQDRIHNAIRTVLKKMNIDIIEPTNTRTKSICCGDSFYGLIPTEKVKEQMKKRTMGLPLDEVVVYCVSCIKSVHIGGKKPRYLVDLLFANETLPKAYEPDEWHKELEDYIEKH